MKKIIHASVFLLNFLLRKIKRKYLNKNKYYTKIFFIFRLVMSFRLTIINLSPGTYFYHSMDDISMKYCLFSKRNKKIIILRALLLKKSPKSNLYLDVQRINNKTGIQACVKNSLGHFETKST